MVTITTFWNTIDNSVKEYLAIRYYKTTRCILTTYQINIIALKEIEFMNNNQ